VSVWQTVLVYAVIPAAAFGLLALLVFGSGAGRPARYRPGRPWEHEPVWYVARPESPEPASSEAGRAALAATDRRALPAPSRPPAAVLDAPTRTARGGASGQW
jgi:hypothetical protein